MSRIAPVLFALFALVSCSCESEPGGACDFETLLAELDAAQPGDVVRVGACRFVASVVVPPGVVLRGAGWRTVLSSAGDAPIIELADGTGTEIRDLRLVVNDGGYAVRASSSGSGRARIENVQISVARGVGIGVDGLARLDIVGSELFGPITAENATAAGSRRDETGTYGVIAIDVGGEDAESGLHIASTRFQGFATGAVALDGGRLDWTGRADEETPDIIDVRGAGVAVFDGSAVLRDLRIASMLATVGVPGVAIAAVSAPTLELRDVHVRDGAGYGVFAEASTVEIHTALIERVGIAGVRLQRGSLLADGLTTVAAGGAGVLAIDLQRVEIARSSFAAQHLVPIIDETAVGVRMADGVTVRRTSIISPPIDVMLDGVRFEDNERAGFLVDAAGDTASVELAMVSARAPEGAWGVVAQDAVLPAGWDATVTREGAAAAMDSSFGGGLDVAGIIMPPAIVAMPGSL